MNRSVYTRSRAFLVIVISLFFGSIRPSVFAQAFPGSVYEKVGEMALPEFSAGFAIERGVEPRSVMLFGGAAGSWSNAIRKYSIATNSWDVLPSTLPYPWIQNERYGAALAANGRYYLCPGNGPGGWGQHARLIEFDPVSGTVSERAPVVAPGFNVWGIALAPAPATRGGVYLFGGWNGGGLSDVRHYDPATNQVTLKGHLSMGRTVGARVAHPNGRVYLFGGNQFHSRAAIDVFDASNESVRAVPNPSGFAFNHGTQGWVGTDGAIYLWNPKAGDLGAQSDSIIRFDPASETFLNLGASPVPGGTPASALRDPLTEDVYTFGYALPGYVWGISGTLVPDVRRLGRGASVAGPILLSDAFDDARQVGWKPYLTGWSEGNGVYSARNHAANVPVESVWQHGFKWGDYAAEADIRLLGGYTPADAQLQFRYRGTAYVQGVEDNCKCALFQYGGTFVYLSLPNGQTQTRPVPYAIGEWKRLRATAVGNTVTCEVLGLPETRMTATTTGSLEGTVALRGTHESADFDNVLVTSIGLYPQIVFRRNGQIWIMRTDGSDQRRLTSGPDDHSPRLRNGVVTFIRNRYQLFRTDTSGTTPAPVPNTANIWEYDLSPDGSEIALAYQNNFTLWRMRMDGTGLAVVHQRDNHHQIYPSFARNGFIYFGQAVFGNPFTQSIWRIPADAAAPPENIVSYFSQFPRFGTISNRVVFLHNQPAPQLRSMRADGSDPRDVPGVPVSVDNYPGVDEETNHVYFCGGGKIWKTDLDGSGLIELATGEAPIDYGLGPLGRQLDTTPPSITPLVSGSMGQGGWYTGDVTVSWTVSDPESAITSRSGCDTATLAADTPGVDYTCTATSEGGTTTLHVSVKRDATPPSIEFGSITPPPNASGWNNTGVDVEFQVTDATSGVEMTSHVSPLRFDAEGSGQTRLVTATDVAGNTVSMISPAISIDRTPPSIHVSRSPEANVAGWNNTTVTASYVAEDGLSGLASPPSGSFAFTTEGASQAHTFTVTDLAGNSAQASVEGVHIDLTPPLVTVQSPLSQSYGLQRNVVSSYACSDGLSGVGSCNGTVPSGAPIDTGTLGPAVFSVSSSDRAGNLTLVAVPYVVVNDAYLLLLDRDAIAAHIGPNAFTRADVNEDIAAVGLRAPLPYFERNAGATITLHSGHLAQEGWFALRSIPPSWAAAGPTSNGLLNFVQAGPGLGAPDGSGDRNALLARVPDVTPLRATGLKALVGERVFAAVFSDHVGINYPQRYGDLKGKNLGIVAFEVVAVTARADAQPNALPAVAIRILDAAAFAQGLTRTMTHAPWITSPTEPADLQP